MPHPAPEALELAEPAEALADRARVLCAATREATNGECTFSRP